MQEAFEAYPLALILATLASIGIVINILPFLWFIRNRNCGAASLYFWLLSDVLFVFLNACIWPHDNTDIWFSGKGLCDIEIRMIVGSWVGLPGSIICINRGLARALDTDSLSLIAPSRAERRRALFIELSICFGIPVLIMLSYYVVQSQRYWILGITGCAAPFADTWLQIPLVYIWPLLLTLVCAYYAILILVRLYRYRQTFTTLLQHSNTSRSHFIRLFVMSFVLLVMILPAQVVILYNNTTIDYVPYSWSWVHSDSWNTVVKVPSNGEAYYYTWIHIGAAYLLFACFGTGKEAWLRYQTWAARIGVTRLLPRLHGGSSTWSLLGSKAKTIFSRSSSGNRSMTDSVFNDNPQSVEEGQSRTHRRRPGSPLQMIEMQTPRRAADSITSFEDHVYTRDDWLYPDGSLPSPAQVKPTSPTDFLAACNSTIHSSAWSPRPLVSGQGPGRVLVSHEVRQSSNPAVPTGE